MHEEKNAEKLYYRFSRPFSSPLHSIFTNVFSISSRTLWNVRMLVSISSLVDQFWNIVIQFRALSPVFVNYNSNSSVTAAEHKTSKINFVYWHSFSSKFHSNSSPRYTVYNAIITALLIEQFTRHIYVALIIRKTHVFVVCVWL